MGEGGDGDDFIKFEKKGARLEGRTHARTHAGRQAGRHAREVVTENASARLAVLKKEGRKSDRLITP